MPSLLTALAIVFAGFAIAKSLQKKNKNTQITPNPTVILNANASTAADLLVGEYEAFLSFCGKDTRH